MVQHLNVYESAMPTRLIIYTVWRRGRWDQLLSWAKSRRWF